uniref:TRAF3-interacting protein 1 n=1 Tax=Aureoumbra lagunensis TaxID=44058 RepID=A0A7S3JTG7_9STRA
MALPLEESIVRTQEVLQPLIAKPQLKEKFLQKPPFRFLHDIVTALIESRGFPAGLYQGAELDSGSYKDKDTKVEFLTKLILCVGICRGRVLEVRETKIVAGLEPERTNELLQEMAYAATDDTVDIPQAIRRTLAGDQPSPNDIPRRNREGSAQAKDTHLEEEEKQSHINNGTQFKKVEDIILDPPLRSESKFAQQDESRLDIKPSSNFDNRGVAQLNDGDINSCDGTIEKTKNILEPIIEKKPKLTEKLLSKPPFRFLHDLISEVTRRTGFAHGLYDEIESDSSQVSDKTAKINYLNKIIQLVNMQLNVAIEAKPVKIVSGLEAENTNRFLQLLGLAAARFPDSRANVAIINGSDIAQAKHPIHQEKTFDHEPSAPTGDISRPSATQEPIHEDNLGGEDLKISQPMGEMTAKEQDDEPPAPLGQSNTTIAQPKRTGRPQTARRKPPRYKEKSEDETMANKTPAIKTSIIIEGADDDDDDDNHEEQIDEKGAEEKLGLGGSGGESSYLIDPLAQGKSKLVREIQEEERAAAKALTESNSANQKGNEEKSNGIRFGRIDRGSQGGSKGKFADSDLNELMSTVQKLCQSTNPLGKCMDYVHEDLSTMNKELDKWQLEFQVQKDLLERERRDESDSTILSLRRTLKDLDDQIVDEVRLTRAVKARIIKHEARIQSLLTMVCTAKYNPSEFSHLATNDDR